MTEQLSCSKSFKFDIPWTELARASSSIMGSQKQGKHAGCNRDDMPIQNMAGCVRRILQDPACLLLA